MKKAIALLLALALVGAAFAQEAAYTLEGSATVTWGFDVDSGANGFENEADFTLTFPLVAEMTTASEAGTGIYGSIEFSEFNLGVTLDQDGELDWSDSAGADITAKIMADPIYVTIYSEPSFAYNNATFFDPMSVDDYEDATFETGSAADDVQGGITIGFKNDMIDFGLNVASNGSWEAQDADATYDWIDDDEDASTAPVWGVDEDATVSVANEDNEYTIGFDITLNPMEMVEVVIGGFYDMWEDAAMGGTVKVTLTPMEGFEVVAAGDFGKVADADMIMDFSLAATYTMANADSLSLYGYILPANEATTILANYSETSWKQWPWTQDDETTNVSVGFRFTEDGAEGFIPNLGFSAYVNALHLLDSLEDPVEGLPVLVGGSFDYTVTLANEMTVKPYAGFDYGLLKVNGDDADNGLAYKVGAEVGLAAKVTVTAEFAAGSVGDDVFLTVSDPAGSDTGKGTFTLACTIDF